MSAVSGGAGPDEETTPGAVGRMLVGLHPPAWRARYGTEFAALLADTAVGVREVADVAVAAAAAWARPAAHLHDRQARLRATAGVVLCGWTALAAGMVLFAKVTGDGAVRLTDPAHQAASRWYDAATLASGGSALAMAVGGLPLAVTVLRTSRGTPYRRRVVVLLAVPVPAVLAFVGVAGAVAGLVTPAARPGAGIGAGWFLVLAAVGLLASAACAAGPALALAHARPDGPSLTRAVVAGACATTLMAVATAAVLACQLSQPPVRLNTAALTVYGVAMTAALLAATISCARGLRAAWPPALRGGHAR